MSMTNLTACRLRRRPLLPALVAAVAATTTMAFVHPSAARALPFDPLPSSFQRWLNGTSATTPALPVIVSGLAECVDGTQPVSPYRIPVYSCLRGEVALRKNPSRRCRLDRLAYFPTLDRLRLWMSPSCGASAEIPGSIPLRKRGPLPPAGGS